MAKKEARPLVVRTYIGYQGKVLPIEAFEPRDADRAMAIAALPMARAMNPSWNVTLTDEARRIDLDAYFKDAPTAGSLFKSEEAQKRIDAEFEAAGRKRSGEYKW